MINDYTFSNALYGSTKNHITIEESTNSLSNSTLYLNKTNLSIALKDIEEAFIHNDIPFKNLKICMKADGTPTTPFNCSDRTQPLKSGLVINNKKQYRLI